MALAFGFLVLAGTFVILNLPARFTAHSSLLIRLGQSYVYQPQVGDAARGAAADNDQVVQSELEILESDAVKIKVVQDIGVSRLSPDLARAFAAADPQKREVLEQSAMRSLARNLKVAAAPGSAIARLTYADTDPARAALVLNTLVDEYLHYRRTVLTDNLAPLDEQRRVFQNRLDAAEAAYQRFLSDNGIGDFDAEKTSLAQIYGQLLTDRYSVGAQSAEVQGRLGATAHEMAGAQPEIGLYRDLDHTAQDKVAQLKVELQDLLSRYQANAQPVREQQQKIAAAEALIGAGQGPGAGARRVGVNPVYQTLQTEKNQLEAQSVSLKDRQARLDQELADIVARRQKLAALEPEYEALARQRELLSANVRNLAQSEQESQAAQGLQQSGDDGSVKVVERAYPPAKGASLRAPLFLLCLVFSAFAAACLGAALALMDPEIPSAAAVERRLRLPVLASIPAK
jgi:uncharacterized protein involved in exopolysaccharide biosynthesis